MFLIFFFSHFSILLVCLNVAGEVQNVGVKLKYSRDGIFRELDSFELVSPAVLNTQERWRRDASTRTKLGHREKVVLMVQRRTKPSLVLDLTLNRDLLVAGFVSKYYDSQGRLATSRAKPDDHCFYRGTLRGAANSVVSISTCKGIEGLIHDGNESYYVQPVNTEGVRQHILYNMRDLKLKEMKCGQGHSINFQNIGSFVHESSFVKHRVRRNADNKVKYVELVLVNDYSQHEHNKKILKDTEYRGKHILNLVDSLYRPLNIRVALLMMITWSSGNQITVDVDSDITLSNFLKYREKEIVAHLKKENIKSHDNAQLLSHKNFKGSTVGKAQVMAMCSSNSGAVVKDHSENAWATAATFAHELGHNFGLKHDEDYNKRSDCNCDRYTGCIMSGIARNKPATKWSPCSREELKKMFDRGLDSCLFNQPRRLHGDAVCGNGFKEEGEECDCGTLEECKRYTDNCCNATTCKLHPYAVCSEGACCDKCKFKPSGKECRAKIDSCDVPEYCDGKSELCPENVYVQNGWPCDGGYCFNGRCPTHDSQCEDLWGKGASNADDVCYTSNVKSERHAHCGVNSTTKNFIKCKKQDIKCGKLWCNKKSKSNLPIIGVGRHGFKQRFPTLDNMECWSATLDLGDEATDPTMVLDGAKCGDNKICYNAKCVHLHDFSWEIASSLCPSNCSGKGVCTTKSECHCDPCWGGSDCSESVRCPWKSDSRTAVAGIVIAVFVIVLLVIGLAFAIRHRRKLYEKWQNYNKKRTSTRRYDHVSAGTPKTGRSEAFKKGNTKAQANSNPAKPPRARLEISGPVKTDSSVPATVVTPSVTTTPKPLAASKPASSGQPNLPSWPPASTEEKPVFTAKSWHEKNKEQPAKAMWKAPVESDDIVSSMPSSGVAPPKKPQWPPPQKEQDNKTSRKPLRPPPLHRASSPPGTLDDNPAIRPRPKTRPGSLAGVLNQEKPGLPGKPGNDTQLSKKPSFGPSRPSPLAQKPSGAQEFQRVDKKIIKPPGLPVTRKPSGAQKPPTKPPLPLGRKPSGAQDLDGVKKGLRPTGVLPGPPTVVSGAKQSTPGGKVPLHPPGKQPSSQH